MTDPDFEEQLRQEHIASEEDVGGNTYTDPDGTVYEWDAMKQAWFPKIDDDFIAQYQMNYGVSSDAGVTEQKTKSGEVVGESPDPCTATNGDRKVTKGVKRKVTDAEDKLYSDFNPPNSDPNSEEYYSYYYQYFSQQREAEPHAGETQEIIKLDTDPSKSDEKQQVESTPSQATVINNKADSKSEGWFEFDSEKGTHVYVSGLPPDITLDEFSDIMSKYGLIMHDHVQKKAKLKLYVDDSGQPKGDGLCVFIKPESVDLCLNLLDGSDLRNHTVHVERATFAMKGNYDPSKKKKKLTNKEKRKLKLKQEKLFSWQPEKLVDTRLKHEKVVVLKNMFDPHDFDEDPRLINDLVADVRSEAAKFGDVKKVNIYDRHPDGVLTVHYKLPEEADTCVEALNGRWFAKRRILAATWDGLTQFQMEESDAERDRRLQQWAQHLGGGPEPTKTDQGDGGGASQ